MIRCTRKIEFDAGHRIIGHKNKCQYLHGHRYSLEVTIESEALDDLGMVIDFEDMKSRINQWINDNFDHSLILSRDDQELGEGVTKVTNQHVYYLANNPTVENIALHLKRDILPKLFDTKIFSVSKVKLYETPNCFVEV